MVAEAKAGNDIAKLRLHGGRPAMRSDPAEVVRVRLDPELREAGEARATATSEIIREALRRYLPAWTLVAAGSSGSSNDIAEGGKIPEGSAVPPAWLMWDIDVVAGIGSYQTEAHRMHRGGGPATDTELGVDVLDVVADRLGADAQMTSDRLVRQPLGHQPEHITLAAGEAERTARAGSAGGQARSREHGVSRDVVESALCGVLAKLSRGIFDDHRRAVRTGLGHRVVGVRGSEDLRRH